jgi:putative restriction endonuclease
MPKDRISASEIERRVRSLKVWQRGHERAPHKPLLLLIAIGRALRGEPRWISYQEVDRKLGDLLREFGPPRRSVHPEYPFWRLQHDCLWEVTSNAPMVRRQGHSDPRKTELLEKQAAGALLPEVERQIVRSPKLAHRLANIIVASSFPESLHEDVLAAAGLDTEIVPEEPTAPGGRRDPDFRTAVLVAYEQRCAVCGFDVRLGTSQLGIDAAHIKWHQAGGPDVVPNGFALCVLHHKLFDRGVFSVDHGHRVIVSEQAHGGSGFELHLLGYHGRLIRPPIGARYQPAGEFLEWHWREVFRSPARDVSIPDAPPARPA